MSHLKRARRAPTPPLIRDPLAVIPLQPPEVEARRDSQGRIQLRLRPPLKGLRKLLHRALGYDYSRTLALDEMGSRFYSLVDGHRTLGDIVEEMASAAGTERKLMADSVVCFTKDLMTRNLIILKVPPAAGEPGS